MQSTLNPEKSPNRLWLIEKLYFVVSHGDLLNVWNTMFLGMDVETLNQFELFGMAGGVSFMLQNDEGKRFIKKMSDLSYMANQFI